MSGPRVRDLLAGTAVLALLAAVVIYAFAGVTPFHHAYALDALVRDANQLRIGSPVRVAGVDEGSVTGIDAGPHGLARVRFELADSARPVHADATIQIRPRTFLEGGFYVDLSPGTPESPELANGATISVAHTFDPVQLSQVLSTFTAPVRADLREIFAQSAVALQGATPDALRALASQLTPTLRDGAWVAQALRGTQPGDLSRLIAAGAQVTGTLANREAQLVDLVRSLRTTGDALTAQEGALGQGVSQLDGLLRDAPPALNALRDAMPALTRFSVAFDPAVRQAPPLLSGLSGAVAQFGSLVAPPERQRVLSAARATLVGLPTLLVRLASEFPALGPTAACLRDRVLPVLDARVPDGSLSTGQPVYEDFLHALVGLASNGQNFDANGYWMRYLGGGGTQTVSLPALGGLQGALPGSSSLAGARPVWLGVGSQPPLRPDAPCAAQPPVNLSSQTAPATASDRGPR